MKAVFIALWRLLRANLFYPVMIGLFLWIYVTDKHWVFGAAIIAAILIFDPIWRIMGRNSLRLLRKKRE
ncbi:MAG: hypothetical protein ACSHXY_06840 [Alphaproteobacteria bacterium]